MKVDRRKLVPLVGLLALGCGSKDPVAPQAATSSLPSASPSSASPSASSAAMGDTEFALVARWQQPTNKYDEPTYELTLRADGTATQVEQDPALAPGYWSTDYKYRLDGDRLMMTVTDVRIDGAHEKLSYEQRTAMATERRNTLPNGEQACPFKLESDKLSLTLPSGAPMSYVRSKG